MPLKGLMDEVAIWSRALSNDEIAALYNDGNGISLIPPAVPVLPVVGWAIAASLLSSGIALLRRLGRRR
jgi:hypothetical protein